MPRPRTLPEKGIRRTITFDLDLDERLAVLAARRRIPLSLLVAELIERGFSGPSSASVHALEFPPNWDGSDLRERLYHLRMRQKDLSDALGMSDRTMSSWVRGHNPIDPKALPRIQKALKAHKPLPFDEFRTGSRSPQF